LVIKALSTPEFILKLILVPANKEFSVLDIVAIGLRFSTVKRRIPE